MKVLPIVLLGVLFALSWGHVAQTQSPDDDIQPLLGDLQDTGASAESLLGGQSHLIHVNGSPVLVFVYEDAEIATAEASGIAPDAASINDQAVTWEATPHFFLADQYLALYLGDDQAVVAILETVMGQAIATGIPPSASDVGTVEDQQSFIEALQQAGVEVESLDEISQPFLEVTGNVISLDGAEVQVFEYPDAESVALDVDQIPADGTSFATIMVTWINTPHFYHQGNLIVLYVGNDPDVLSLLESLLGSQFAGG